MTSRFGVEGGSDRHREFRADHALFEKKFAAHPFVTLLHVLPSALFMILGPLQFSTRFRARHLRFHRGAGRVLLAAALGIGASALFLGLSQPFGGPIEAAATAVFGGYFLLSAARAFISIRRGDVARHREWMIRMFSVAIGVSTIRLVEPLLVIATGYGVRTLFGPSLWVGWVLTIGAAELWVRRAASRSAPAAQRAGAAGAA